MSQLAYPLPFKFLQVTVHLSKLFASISDLEFATNEQGDHPKLAVGMYSKEREYVPFLAACRCFGPVSLHSGSNIHKVL